MARTLVLDLDGTLVDTLPDLAAALNRLMTGRGLSAFASAEVAVMIGDGVAVLVERAFAARALPVDPAALADFLADYGAHVACASRAFPGVAETLATLVGRDWRLAVCTNKPESAARRLLATLGLGDYFAAIGGGDSFPVRKPDPAHLLATIAAAGGSPARALMVGDHRNDIAAAAGAAIPCVFAAWGYGAPEMAAGAAAVANRFRDLLALTERLVPPT